MSFRIMGLTKVAGTEPQEFVLFLKDLENTKPSYIGETEHGTESVLREALTNGGMKEPEIDVLFWQAK